jgi:DNA repair exonuclease SbcCD ATPase subunit
MHSDEMEFVLHSTVWEIIHTLEAKNARIKELEKALSHRNDDLGIWIGLTSDARARIKELESELAEAKCVAGRFIQEKADLEAGVKEILKENHALYCLVVDNGRGFELNELNKRDARIKELEAELNQTKCVYCHKALNRPSPTCCVAHDVEARK